MVTDSQPRVARRAWLFGLLLVVPLLTFVTAEALQPRLTDKLHDALRRELRVNRDAMGRMSVAQICAYRAAPVQKLCTFDRELKWLRAGAAGAGLISMALLLAIRRAGAAAQRNRYVLLRVFKPGLYLTAAVLIVLVGVHGALVMGTLINLQAILGGRALPGTILPVAVGAFAGVAIIAGNCFTIMRKAEASVIGTWVSRTEAPRLYDRIVHLCAELGAMRPQHIVIGLDPNFFVTEARVIALNGTLQGRTLFCSLSLARIMTLEEFDAVVGHELGHFKGLDTEFSRKFYPIYRGTYYALARLVAVPNRLPKVAMLPAIAVLSYFYEAFALAERRHGRQRELEADAEGASVTSAATVATALLKTHAFAGSWISLQKEVAAAVESGSTPINLSRAYADKVRDAAVTEQFRGLADSRVSHPTDSHPPLGERFTALNVTLEQVAAAARQVTPADPAISLIDQPDQIEQELSRAYRAVLVQNRTS